MINRIGFNGLNKNLSKPQGSRENLNNTLSTINNKVIVGRVTDIILDENHPKFNEVGGWNGLGTIFYEVNNIISTRYDLTAKSLNPQNKNYPLINEMVLLFYLPDNLIGENNSSKSYYYINHINIWNHPHHNAYPNPLDNILPKSQQKDYNEVEGGSIRRVTDGSTEINLNSPINPSQNTFIEKINIHPLLAFNGDILYEGRFGQSLRLGNTSKSDSQYKNNWSNSGEDGDPIVIIRNGQPKNSSEEGWIPITEDINKDLSSIYLTSFQKIPIILANENFNSYITPPDSPKEYTSPQILLTSNRIIINAEEDSVLLNAQKSIGLASNESINIESPQMYISSNDIKLGSKNASEPVLKGDITIELLKQLTKAVKDLATILEVENKWPEGKLQTGYNIIAGNVLVVIDKISSQLNDNSLKSKTTKVQ
tara:strand:+ start:36 stop:1310 length:1275 start_codon:yes stop_codon:yes gene_type:complete